MDGLRLNARVGVQYLAAWLAGSGSVPLYNLMEDAATAEISRVQNWQWLRRGAALDTGGVEVRATPELLARVMEEEMARIQAEVGPERFRQGRYAEAGRIFSRQCTAPELDDFLTLDAYNLIVVHHPRRCVAVRGGAAEIPGLSFFLQNFLLQKFFLLKVLCFLFFFQKKLCSPIFFSDFPS